MTPMKDEQPTKIKAQSRTVTTEEKTDRRRDASALNIAAGNPLQLLLSQRMLELGRDGKPLTLREVEERSGRVQGRFRVSRSTVSNILNGKTIKLTAETIGALGKALRLDDDLIVQAVEQTTLMTLEMPVKLRKLSPEGWRDLLEYGEYLLAREGK